MEKIDYCYHSHTKRCGHAEGEDEEYILTAIENGLKEYGVSDHIFLPAIKHLNVRGDISFLDDYINSINNLKKKYKDKINIHIGFEAEYMDEFLPYYKSLLDSHKIEYLILGQHCYYKNGNHFWYYDIRPIEQGLKKYTEDVIKGIESGLFKYLAHPDLFCIFYNKWDELAIECSKKIIDASIKNNVPLEINLCKVRAMHYGYIEHRYDCIYPYDKFWELVSKSKAHVVVGYDSHNPKHNILDNMQFVKALVDKTHIQVDYHYRIDK